MASAWSSLCTLPPAFWPHPDTAPTRRAAVLGRRASALPVPRPRRTVLPERLRRARISSLRRPRQRDPADVGLAPPEAADSGPPQSAIGRSRPALRALIGGLAHRSGRAPRRRRLRGEEPTGRVAAPRAPHSHCGGGSGAGRPAGPGPQSREWPARSAASPPARPFPCGAAAGRRGEPGGLARPGGGAGVGRRGGAAEGRGARGGRGVAGPGVRAAGAVGSRRWRPPPLPWTAAIAAPRSCPRRGATGPCPQRGPAGSVRSRRQRCAMAPVLGSPRLVPAAWDRGAGRPSGK